jgi:hypothetical protein
VSWCLYCATVRYRTSTMFWRVDSYRWWCDWKRSHCTAHVALIHRQDGGGAHSYSWSGSSRWGNWVRSSKDSSASSMHLCRTHPAGGCGCPQGKARRALLPTGDRLFRVVTELMQDRGQASCKRRNHREGKILRGGRDASTARGGSLRSPLRCAQHDKASREFLLDAVDGFSCHHGPQHFCVAHLLGRDREHIAVEKD